MRFQAEAARQIIRGLTWSSSALSEVFHAGHRLTWRHHGLGMLQAELSETLRIHIWHPKLVSPEMAWPRCVHDHRFDLESAVVIGAVRDVLPDVRSANIWDEGIITAHPLDGWESADAVAELR
jgi:hypothetical protein